MGYYRAGFDVVGVDINPQPNYPFEFHQADALTYPLDGFDAIHASPPCQAYSSMTFYRRSASPKLIEPIRDRLIAAGVPYVIENVERAPLINPIRLCGSMFGLGVYRHRKFESTVMMLAPTCSHDKKPLGIYGHLKAQDRRPGGVRRPDTLAEARAAMGIDWMNWNEIVEAIPPAYTEFIGQHLIQAMEIAA